MPTGKESYITVMGSMGFESVQSGDLLAWGDDPNSTTSDLLIKAIRWFTGQKYGHVGIAWRLHDGLKEELFVIEATLPKIRIQRLSTRTNVDVIPMNVVWTESSKAFLMDKLGLLYGVLDALRAGLGVVVEKDDKWQCAELALEFYQSCGIALKSVPVPGKLVRAAADLTGFMPMKVVW